MFSWSSTYSLLYIALRRFSLEYRIMVHLQKQNNATLPKITAQKKSVSIFVKTF